MKRFVSYLRISNGKSGGSDSHGIAAQRISVLNYISGQQGTLIQEHVEIESGRNNKRPILSLALSQAKKESAILVISKMDRLSRSASFLLALMESNLDFVALDAIGVSKLHLSILAIFAQNEVERTSQRVTDALKIAVSRGKVLGNPRLHLARQNALVAVSESRRAFNATILPIINDIRLSGINTLQGLATALNRRGYSGARGGAFTATAVRNILKEF